MLEVSDIQRQSKLFWFVPEEVVYVYLPPGMKPRQGLLLGCETDACAQLQQQKKEATFMAGPRAHSWDDWGAQFLLSCASLPPLLLDPFRKPFTQG